MYGLLALVKPNGELKNLLANSNMNKLGFDSAIFIEKAPLLERFLGYFKPYLLIVERSLIDEQWMQRVWDHCGDGNQCIICGQRNYADMKNAFLHGAADYLAGDGEIRDIEQSIRTAKAKLDRHMIESSYSKSQCIIQFFQNISPVITRELVLDTLKIKGSYAHYRCLMNSLKINDEMLDESLFRSFDVAKITIGDEHPSYIINYEERDEALLRDIVTDSCINLHIGVSDRFERLEEIQFYLKQAKKRSYRSFFGESDAGMFYSSDARIVGDYIDSFDAAMQTCQAEPVIGVVNQIITYFKQNRLTIDSLEIVYNHFVDMLIRISLKHETEIGDIKRFANCGQMVDYFGDIHVMIDYLNKKIIRIFNALDADELESTSKANDAKLYEIKAYVDEHYRENLKVSSLSGKFYLSPNYLSNQFKKFTSKSLARYMLDKRLEYSVFLLQNTTLKIMDISVISGFNDYSYFKRIFKRSYQYTPTEYRNHQRVGNQKERM